MISAPRSVRKADTATLGGVCKNFLPWDSTKTQKVVAAYMPPLPPFVEETSHLIHSQSILVRCSVGRAQSELTQISCSSFQHCLSQKLLRIGIRNLEGILTVWKKTCPHFQTSVRAYCSVRICCDCSWSVHRETEGKFVYLDKCLCDSTLPSAYTSKE